MRQYTDIELLNINYLESLCVRFALVNLTQNILDHGIFDATRQIKQFLQEANIHDFEKQSPGEKVLVSTHILTFNRNIQTNSSLYRSGKRGDKRMWFGSEIYSVVDDNDICALFCLNRVIYVVNISKLDIEYCNTSASPNEIKNCFPLFDKLSTK